MSSEKSTAKAAVPIPYIPAEDRAEIRSGERDAETPGELNFVLTEKALQYLDDHEPVNYTLINEVVGALECAKQEFIRRVLTPFEDTKILQNGDLL